MNSALSSTEIIGGVWSSAFTRQALCTRTPTVWRRNSKLLLRFRPADYAACDARACVAGWLSLEIVGFRVDDDRAADRRFRIVREGNLMVHIIQLGIAGSVCFHISHVALVPRRCIWPGVRLVGWIEVRARGTCIGCAAIAEFMDVKTVFTGRQTSDFCVDLHAVSDRRECDYAGDFIARGGMQHRNAF